MRAREPEPWRDRSLPTDLNGCDLQKLIADRADMPIIFVTDHADVPTTVRTMKAGAVEFLAKPFVTDMRLDAGLVVSGHLNKLGGLIS